MKKPTNKISVLGIPVSPAGVGDVPRLLAAKTVDESLLITFVNPQACALGEQYDDYIQLLESFDIVTCDGIGMVKAARAGGARNTQRESFDFTSLAGAVCQWAAQTGRQVGLVGGKPGVTEQAATVLMQKYQGLQIAACYSGFGQSPVEARQFFLDSQTDIIICGMGAPLQERFLLQLVADGWRGIGFTCGGFLDQVITGDSYYPGWVDRLNLRFLYRLTKEPRRLWRRYLADYQVFIRRYIRLQWTVLKSKLGVGPSAGKNQ